MRAANRAARQVKPSNGSRLATIVEDIKERVDFNHDHIMMLHEDMQDHRASFQEHIKDERSHWREAHELLHGKTVCNDCASIVMEYDGQEDG